MKNMLQTAVMIISILVASCNSSSGKGSSNNSGDNQQGNGNTQTISATALFSNNKYPEFARDGDTITLDFTSDESIDAQLLVVTIADVSADISGNGIVWRATTTAPSDPALDGAVQFVIRYNSKTLLSDKTADNQTVVLDNTPPAFLSGKFGFPVPRGKDIEYSARFSEPLEGLPNDSPQVSIISDWTTDNIFSLRDTTSDNTILHYQLAVPERLDMAIRHVTIQITGAPGITDRVGNPMTTDHKTDNSNEDVEGHFLIDKPSWKKIYGEDNSSDSLIDIVGTNDGGYAVLGRIVKTFADVSIDPRYGIRLLKLNGDGNMVWQKKREGTNQELLRSLIKTADGNLVVLGYNFSNNSNWLWKVDVNNGTTIWEKQLGEGLLTSFLSLLETTDGKLLVAGTALGKSLLVQHDASGDNELWKRTYHTDERGNETCFSHRETANGDFILAGYSKSAPNGDDDTKDGLLRRVDANGNELWDKTYGGNAKDEINAVIETNDGNFIATGLSKSNENGDDIWLLMVDSSGDVLWEKRFGNNNDDVGNSVIQTRDGNFVVAGGLDNKFWMSKVDASGDVLWQKTYDYDNSTIEHIVETSDGKLVVAGTDDVGTLSSSLVIMKLDANGNLSP